MTIPRTHVSLKVASIPDQICKSRVLLPTSVASMMSHNASTKLSYKHCAENSLKKPYSDVKEAGLLRTELTYFR